MSGATPIDVSTNERPSDNNNNSTTNSRSATADAELRQQMEIWPPDGVSHKWTDVKRGKLSYSLIGWGVRLRRRLLPVFQGPA